MSLKITKSDEPIEVKNICFTIYSQPGLGKTSLAFTASKPLLLDFDEGSYRAVDRKDVVQIEKWADVAGITADDVTDFDTIVIDTVGKALDFLAADIIASNKRFAYGGALNQQGWGQLGVRFRAFLSLLKRLGKDVVLVSHMDEKSDGDAIKERLKIQGGTKDVVLVDSDVIARISIYNRERHLVFSPTDTSFGKDPANLSDVVIPDASDADFADFLSQTIAKVKEGLNKLSEAQIARKGEVDWFADALPEIKDADGINALLGRSKKAGRDVAKMVVGRADELGLIFDGGERRYVYLEDAETGERPDGESDEPTPDELMRA